jgi:hypothetical protein
MSGVGRQERPLCHARRAQYCTANLVMQQVLKVAASEAEMRRSGAERKPKCGEAARLPSSACRTWRKETSSSARAALPSEQGNSRRPAGWRPREGHRPAKQPIWSVLLLLGCEREGGPRELRELTTSVPSLAQLGGDIDARDPA